MKYSSLTNDNRSSIKRFSHDGRFRQAIKILKSIARPDCGSVLDYGAGSGEFLQLLDEQVPSLEIIIGYEPNDSQYQQLQTKMKSGHLSPRVAAIQKIDDTGRHYDVIFCMEVFEHFTSKNTIENLQQITRLLLQTGSIIVSVPIETGFAGFMKNMVRLVIRQAHQETMFRNVAKAFFKVPIKRGDRDYISSHIGFSHRDFEHLVVSTGLRIVAKSYSPLPFFGPYLNSQIFYVLSK